MAHRQANRRRTGASELAVSVDAELLRHSRLDDAPAILRRWAKQAGLTVARHL